MTNLFPNDTPDTTAQKIAKSILVKIREDQYSFNKLVESQKTLAANMLAQDIGLELDQVIKVSGELGAIRKFMLDANSEDGISILIESYYDDSHFLTVRPYQITTDLT
jgi:DNA-binding transcriptional MocR family regulator